MEINPLLVLCLAWVLGVGIGIIVFHENPEAPTLTSVIGFVLLAGLASIFYFGKTAPLALVIVGILEAGYVNHFLLAGMLLGICSIGAAVYGKTLGMLALEDFYENAQTRLPGLTLAALLNLALIIGFALAVWILFTLLPTTDQLAQWIPLAGLGV